MNDELQPLGKDPLSKKQLTAAQRSEPMRSQKCLKNSKELSDCQKELDRRMEEQFTKIGALTARRCWVKNRSVKEQPFDQFGNEILAKEPIPQEEGTSEEPEDVDELTQKVAMKGKGKGITHKETCSTSRRLSNNIPKVRLKTIENEGCSWWSMEEAVCIACFMGVMGTKEHMRLTVEVYHNLKVNIIVGEYRDKVEPSKITGWLCGIPTQKWYHLPRSYLVEGKNELVLFEEFGGSFLWRHPRVETAISYKEIELDANLRLLFRDDDGDDKMRVLFEMSE
ncbi:hypothetical protein Tco_0701612 [Tanacetum coccineum]